MVFTLKIIEKTIQPVSVLPASLLSYLPDTSIAVLDIETMGLSASRHRIALIGLILIKAQELLCFQFLSDHPADEEQALRSFFLAAADVNLFVTYNGDAFDIPFINSRCRALGLAYAIRADQSLDLYRILRRTYFSDMLPDLKQKTVERLFSQDRTDQISSQECVALFQRYCETKDKDAARTLLLHNYDDVRLLYETLQVFARLDVHEIMFARGFFVVLDMPPRIKISVRSVSIRRDALSFEAHSPAFRSYLDEYWGACRLRIDPAKQCLFLHIPLQSEPDFSYLDLSAFGLAEKESDLPGVFSGFLVTQEQGKANYIALRTFIQDLLCQIARKYGIMSCGSV